MATISPLLKSQIESGGKNHENIYRHLTRHANDVKPNLPKAKLIRENTLQSAVSAVKDTFQDGKNFFKAAKTGKMNDNNLGRINDLGMKAGALIIASFLASRAKTKTDAIMQFIGGTTFFASMALWPKIAINLPARLVHGFRIDHKYLSAQGDKKDLGLDNQFQPMDIFSDEEMMEMAKKSGIDPNDEFAKEKMQRKLQKTMLQNRTLWMATAGFATPLMTSLFGNFIEPKVRDGVIAHGFKKTNDIISDESALAHYLTKSKPIIQNQDAIENMFKGMENAPLGKDFYQKLADNLDLNNIFKQFKDSDDITPIEYFKSKNLVPVLEQIRENQSFIDKKDLIEKIKDMTVMKDGVESLLADAGKQPLGQEEAENLLRNFGDKISITDAKDVINERFGKEDVDKIVNSLKADNSQFFNIVKNYNATVLSTLRGRLKAYMDLLNPVVGSKAESKYTAEFNSTMKDIFANLGITDKDYKFMKNATIAEQQEYLSGKVKEFVGKNPNYIQAFMTKDGKKADEITDIIAQTKSKLEEFRKAAIEYANKVNVDPNRENTFVQAERTSLKSKLKDIFGEDFYLVKEEGKFDDFAKWIKSDKTDWMNQIIENYIESDGYQNSIKEKVIGEDKIEEVVAKLVADKNLEQIDTAKDDVQSISKAITGDKSKLGIPNFIKTFVENKKIDLLSTKYKPIIAANFETRLAKGEFSHLNPNQIQALKNIVYDGTISMRFNNAEIKNKKEYLALVNELFNDKAFLDETLSIPGFAQVIKNLKDATTIDGEKLNTAKYFRAGSFSELVKNFGTSLYENKAWKKIFVPLAIGVAAVTLLVQPLFGKIDKEFPKKSKKEGVNNGNK